MVRGFILLCLLGALNLASTKECGECNLNECSNLDRSLCWAGVGRDECNCCQVCSKLEGEACDLEGSPAKFGKCGDHLECRPRSDDLLAGYCACKYQEVLCGSDMTTYDNFCKLSQSSKSLGDESLKVKNMGKCLIAPSIISGPPNVMNFTGGNIAMICEAFGYPIPYMVWQYKDAAGKTFNLPGDDYKISMNVRGGPEKSQVTGWLQIVDVNKNHEGDYKCIAKNSEGEIESFGRLTVFDNIGVPEEGGNETV